MAVDIETDLEGTRDMRVGEDGRVAVAGIAGQKGSAE